MKLQKPTRNSRNKKIINFQKKKRKYFNIKSAEFQANFKIDILSHQILRGI